jgi:hypothetical protein
MICRDIQHDVHLIGIFQANTVRTLDRRTSWGPCKNSIKASPTSFKEPPFSSTQSFWEWVTPSTTTTHWSWLLALKELSSFTFCQLRRQICPYRTCTFQLYDQISSKTGLRLSLQHCWSSLIFHQGVLHRSRGDSKLPTTRLKRTEIW